MLDPPLTVEPIFSSMKDNQLNPAVTEYIAAVNAFDLERIVAAFTPDAIVNDARREFRGADAIRRWVAKEIVGDKVTMKVTEVTARTSETVVSCLFDGIYDKTGLPPELVLTSYFTVREGRISMMIIVFNRDASLPQRG